MNIIATFKAHATENTPEIEVCVQEHPEQGHFRVFVNGGFCSTGVEAAIMPTLAGALAFATEEIRIALAGE